MGYTCPRKYIHFITNNLLQKINLNGPHCVVQRSLKSICIFKVNNGASRTLEPLRFFGRMADYGQNHSASLKQQNLSIGVRQIESRDSTFPKEWYDLLHAQFNRFPFVLCFTENLLCL